MTDQAHLLRLCQEIASMVPSHKLPDTATPQFTQFIKDLREKVKEHEINSIIRAYNYFNYLMGIGQEVDDTSGSNDLNDSNDSNDSIEDGAVSKKKRRSNEPNETKSEPKDEPPDTESEDLIQLLLNLTEENEVNEGEAKEGVGKVKEGVGEAKEGVGEAKEGVGEAKEGEAKEGVGEAKEGDTV